MPTPLKLRRMPYPPYNDDPFVIVVQNQLPLLLMLSFVFIALNIVKDVVHEKEKRIKVSPTFPVNFFKGSQREIPPMIGLPKLFIDTDRDCVYSILEDIFSKDFLFGLKLVQENIIYRPKI